MVLWHSCCRQPLNLFNEKLGVCYLIIYYFLFSFSVDWVAMCVLLTLACVRLTCAGHLQCVCLTCACVRFTGGDDDSDGIDNNEASSLEVTVITCYNSRGQLAWLHQIYNFCSWSNKITSNNEGDRKSVCELTNGCVSFAAICPSHNEAIQRKRK